MAAPKSAAPAAKVSVPSINEVDQHIKKGRLLPVYFFFGDDAYQMNETISKLETLMLKEVEPEFDRRVYFSKTPMEDIVSDISAFPFGGAKKLVIIKEFEMKTEAEKNKIAGYLSSPSPFTYLIISFAGKITAFSSAYLKALTLGGYLFESKTMKADSLEEWLVQYAASKDKVLSHDDARYLLMITGEERALLEMQIEKILLYMGTENKITFEMISSQAIKTKKFTIFDLDQAIHSNDRETAFKVTIALLNQGEVPLKLLGFLNKLFINLARVPEILEKQVSNVEAAKMLGIPSWTLPKLAALSKRYPQRRLNLVAQALLEADLDIKTSKFDNLTIVSKLITAIFNDK